MELRTDKQTNGQLQTEKQTDKRTIRLLYASGGPFSPGPKQVYIEFSTILTCRRASAPWNGRSILCRVYMYLDTSTWSNWRPMQSLTNSFVARGTSHHWQSTGTRTTDLPMLLAFTKHNYYRKWRLFQPCVVFLFTSISVHICAHAYMDSIIISDTSVHPIPFWGLAYALIVETCFPELVVSVLDFSPWIPIGTFSISL